MIRVPRAVRLTIDLLPFFLPGMMLVLIGAIMPISLLSGTAMAAAGLSRTRSDGDGTLLRDPATGDFYLVYNQVTHAIVDADSVAALGLSAASAMTATPAILAGMPTGSGISIRYVRGQPWPFSLIASGAATLSADTPAGASGSIVRLTGTHFGPSELVHIRYAHGAGALDVQADTTGSFSVSIALPANEALETMRIFAYGATTTSFAVEPFTIIPAPPVATVTGVSYISLSWQLYSCLGGRVRAQRTGRRLFQFRQRLHDCQDRCIGQFWWSISHRTGYIIPRF